MKKKKILHILAPDKFTIPFIQFINKEFDPNDHLFLCSIKPDENQLSLNSNVVYLHTRYRKNIIKNTMLFNRCLQEASKIIMHGNPVLFYLLLFPWVLKKTYWIIYGYELGNSALPGEKAESNLLRTFIKGFVLKRVHGHITHIEGDSELANSLFKSSAKFYYSPMYQSNVVTNYTPEKRQLINKPGVKKILVGNSTCPTNNHSTIFKLLLPYKEDDILIYCPLSYGTYDEYRDGVIRMGKELFSDKFIPITNFMKLEEYNSFLDEIDIAIFNHKRQEAMGVTLSLLSKGKTVFMNSLTTSYNSLTERGFKVFDNTLIEKEGLYVKRDVTINPEQVYNYYSYDILKSSLAKIFND